MESEESRAVAQSQCKTESEYALFAEIGGKVSAHEGDWTHYEVQRCKGTAQDTTEWSILFEGEGRTAKTEEVKGKSESIEEAVGEHEEPGTR